MAESDLTVLAVGDVFLDRPDRPGALKNVQSLFRAANIVFGNCEGVYAEQGGWERAPSCAAPVVADPAAIKALADAGLTVMSLANNHSLDGGYRAMLATRDALQKAGIAISGAGENYAAARRPATLQRAGQTVSVLAYTSVFPHGYEARPKTPGLAVLRAHTICVPWEANEWYPGLLPRVMTLPHSVDEEALAADIAQAREEADIVLLSFHWGDHTRPYVLTDHERRTARLAIDAGADAVLGHHHHMLRGVEFHKGKPIFYGLGHFAFDLPDFNARVAAAGYMVGSNRAEERAQARRFGEYRLREYEGYPLLPFHPDARLTMIAGLTFSCGQLSRVYGIPCLLGADNSPLPVDAAGPEGTRIVNYLQRCCDEEDLSTLIAVEGATGDGHGVAAFVARN